MKFDIIEKGKLVDFDSRDLGNVETLWRHCQNVTFLGNKGKIYEKFETDSLKNIQEHCLFKLQFLVSLSHSTLPSGLFS